MLDQGFCSYNYPTVVFDSCSSRGMRFKEGRLRGKRLVTIREVADYIVVLYL